MLAHISLIICMIALLSCEEQGKSYPSEGKVSIAYLQSLATERSMKITQDIYIEGCVVANDKLFEIEKALVIADDSGGMELKIDEEYINDIVPLFSHVRLRCSGLNIGREGAKLVIGAPPTSEYVVDRIASEEIFNYLTFTSNNPTAPPSATIDINDLDSRSVLRYARFEDMVLSRTEQGAKWCDMNEENEYRSTVRHFIHDSDTLRVVTSGGCYYASELIPTTECTLIGIIDWYEEDYALRITSHQVLR